MQQIEQKIQQLEDEVVKDFYDNLKREESIKYWKRVKENYDEIRN